MKWLLWYLVGISAVNTVVVIFDRFRTPITTLHRAVDAAMTLAMGAWALWLLASGGAQ